MKNDFTLREAFAAVLGGAVMLGAMLLAQYLDADDMRRERELLRAKAATAGFDEGLGRIRCAGGLRYDTTTGQYVDFEVAQ